MTAFILAAGLGTRLKPWTLSHPKALVPVGGAPMLERVIRRLGEEGFNRVVVNIHHFGEQIVDFIDSNDLGVETSISDERDELLDTGGGLLKAFSKLAAEGEPFLVHNVDILSNAPLGDIMRRHIACGNDISLVTSDRESSRRLVFRKNATLCGWHNVNNDLYRPEGFLPDIDMHQHAFSGIYVVNPSVFNVLQQYSESIASSKFPIIDFFLWAVDKLKIGELFLSDLQLIDIGKPDTLSQAEHLFSGSGA